MTSRRRAARVVWSPDPSAVGRIFELDGASHLIGRAAEGPGGVRDDLMSREHAQLEPRSPDDYVIRDLGTSNGTLVDGFLIDRPVSLAPGSVLALGETLLVVDEEPEPSSLPVGPSADGSTVSEVVGVSFAADRLRRSIVTAAKARGSVLLLGATGTGKEVAARPIHRLGSSASGPWVPVNCAAVPGEIAEAEFFGYKKGAFTGAATDRDGYFVQASGGTLFLDEVGDLPVPLQAKLLRALEDGTVRPLGGTSVEQVSVRVVAATHIDLDATGFRRDLLGRLGDWVLHLPPLAERRADIIVLWEHFLRREAPGEALKPCTFEFAHALLLHDWSLNIRELQKLARRLWSVVEEGEAFGLDLLPPPLQARVLGAPKKAHAEVRSHPEPDVGSKAAKELPPLGRDQLEAALKSTNGNVRKISEQLGCHRTQLYRRLRQLGLEPDDFRQDET
jgi:two-component system NtrC family response regulator